MVMLFVIQLLSRFMNRKSLDADLPGTHEMTCGSHISLSVRQDITCCYLVTGNIITPSCELPVRLCVIVYAALAACCFCLSCSISKITYGVKNSFRMLTWWAAE